MNKRAREIRDIARVGYVEALGVLRGTRRLDPINPLDCLGIELLRLRSIANVGAAALLCRCESCAHGQTKVDPN